MLYLFIVSPCPPSARVKKLNIGLNIAFLKASIALVGSWSVMTGTAVKSMCFVFSIISKATVIHGRSISAWNTSSDVTCDIIAGTTSSKSDTNVWGCQAKSCKKTSLCCVSYINEYIFKTVHFKTHIFAVLFISVNVFHMILQKWNFNAYHLTVLFHDYCQRHT